MSPNQIEHEPPPNVLLAGVQYLLMDTPDTDLSAFYPNLTDSPSPIHGVDRHFAVSCSSMRGSWSRSAPKLTIDDGSGPEVIGQGHPHGEWVELYARP